MKRSHVKVLVVASAIASGACSSKSSSSDETASANKDLKSLNLKGVLSLELPDSVTGQGKKSSSLRLSESKSYEACEVRSAIKQMSQMFQMTTSTLCMSEQMGVQPGKKYSINLSDMMGSGAGGEGAEGAGGPGGEEMPPMPLTEDAGFDMPEKAQIWIDNSVADKTKVYLCTDGKLNTMFEFEGSGEKTKGIVYTKGDFGDMTFQSNITFDRNFSKDDVVTMNVQDKFDTSGDGFANIMNLVLNDKTKLNAIAVAKKGSFSSMTFEDSFAAMISDKLGMAMHYDKATQVARKSFFDGAGYNVAEDSSADFAGDLKVEQKDLLAIPTDFTPKSFPKDAWDCKGTEELKASEPSEKEMEKCMEEPSFLEESCSTGFDPGADAGSVDETKMQDIPKFDE